MNFVPGNSRALARSNPARGLISHPGSTVLSRVCRDEPLLVSRLGHFVVNEPYVSVNNQSSRAFEN